jgi:hypothetical protein
MGQQGRRPGNMGGEEWSKFGVSCRINIFEFINRILDSKIKGFKYF